MLPKIAGGASRRTSRLRTMIHEHGEATSVATNPLIFHHAARWPCLFIAKPAPRRLLVSSR